jgi:outer membrane protein assembly factor BamB
MNFSVALTPNGTIICPGIGRNQAPLYAVDTSGKMLWRFVASGMGSNITTSSPCIDNDGNIYFACDQALYSLTSGGKLRWQSAGVSCSGDIGPVIGKDGTLYITGGYFIMAYDYAGSLKWRYPVQTSQSFPAIDVDGTIYVGTNTYRTPSDSLNFLALNPDGSIKFTLSLREQDGRVADIVSRPAISSNGTIYVGSDQPHSYRIFKIR